MSDNGTGLVSLVIPITHGDVDLALLLREYGESLTRQGYPHEFVFVLDGVSGGIERDLREHAKRYPIKIVRLHGGGLGASIALSAGVQRASGDYIINAPSYLQIEPDDVAKVVQAMHGGAEFVATWRSPRIDPWLNRLQSRFFNWCLKVLMGVKFNDLNSSVRGMRRHVLDDINVYGELYRFLPVLAMRQGFRTVEVKVRHRAEEGRVGFYGIGVYLRRTLDILAITFLTRFTQRPLRFFGMLGMLSIALGLVLSIDPLLGKMAGDTGAKPMLVVGTVLVAFGIQLIAFGLVGEIIIFTQASNLRDYKVDEELAGTEEFVGDPVHADVVADDGLPVRVRELAPGEDARWDAFVRHHGEGSFYHLSGWRKCVEDTFHHPARCFVAERGRQWLGVLPIHYVRSPFIGNNLISNAYGVYGGVIADQDDVRGALLQAAVTHGEELNAGYLEMRHVARQFPDLKCSTLYVTFRKQLPTDPEQVMPGIPKKARAEVRRAIRNGVTFEESRDLDLFYELFSINKRSLGSPSLPRRWFRALMQEFGSQVVLHVARDADKTPLAAVMSFCFNGVVSAYYSGARREANRAGVNNFIYCKIMEWGVENGYRVYDFGRSRRETGVASFKRNMGFEEEPLHYEYVLLREGVELPAFHPSNPKLRVPQRIWANLPGFVTDRLGGHLSRYLP